MKKLLLKAAALAAVVLVAQYVYTVVNPPKMPRQVRLLKGYLKDNTDIIYFGDSTVHHYSESDRNRHPISKMLAELPPRYTVGKVAAAAYSQDVFVECIDYLLRVGGKPRFVVLPVNLGSFSPEWDMRPEYQFEKEKLYLKLAGHPLLLMFYRPLAVFGDLQPVSRSEYMHQPVLLGNQIVGTVEGFDNESFETASDEKMRKKLILRYMAQLDPKHRKLRSMLRIGDLLKTTTVQPVFYISPVDYETGERFLGPQFKQRIAENCKTVKMLLEDKGLDVLDLSLALDSASFNWGRYPGDHLYPNEHMKERGRWYVAQELSRKIVATQAAETAERVDRPELSQSGSASGRGRPVAATSHYGAAPRR